MGEGVILTLVWWVLLVGGGWRGGEAGGGMSGDGERMVMMYVWVSRRRRRRRKTRYKTDGGGSVRLRRLAQRLFKINGYISGRLKLVTIFPRAYSQVFRMAGDIFLRPLYISLPR